MSTRPHSATDTPDVQTALGALARRHDFSIAAVMVMRDALVRGNGRLAQFSHREIGGSRRPGRGAASRGMVARRIV